MGFLKSVSKKIGKTVANESKKIGKTVVNESKKIGSKVATLAKSAAKGTTKALVTAAKASQKPMSIMNTSFGKAATMIGKSTGFQPLTELGRGYKALGRAGKNGLKHKHKSKAKNFRKLEKHVVKGSALVAAKFL